MTGKKKSTFTIRVFTRSRGVFEQFGNFYRPSRLQVTKSTWSSRLGSEVDSPSRDSTIRVTATLARVDPRNARIDRPMTGSSQLCARLVCSKFPGESVSSCHREFRFFRTGGATFGSVKREDFAKKSSRSYIRSMQILLKIVWKANYLNSEVVRGTHV